MKQGQQKHLLGIWLAKELGSDCSWLLRVTKRRPYRVPMHHVGQWLLDGLEQVQIVK